MLCGVCVSQPFSARGSQWKWRGKSQPTAPPPSKRSTSARTSAAPWPPCPPSSARKRQPGLCLQPDPHFRGHVVGIELRLSHTCLLRLARNVSMCATGQCHVMMNISCFTPVGRMESIKYSVIKRLYTIIYIRVTLKHVSVLFLSQNCVYWQVKYSKIR